MRALLVVLVLTGSSLRGSAEPARKAPTASTTTAKSASDCGAPCVNAEQFLGGKSWDYRKAVPLYKQACKANQSGSIEACRLLALAGFKTRGISFKKPVVLAMLAKTCKRGDAPSCAWIKYISSNASPTALAMVNRSCAGGDRAACEPLLLAIKAQVQGRKACEPAWWKVAIDGCDRGNPEACVVYRDLKMAEETCKAPATATKSLEALSAEIDKHCRAGDPDSCLDISPNDQLHWDARCKAGEQFACDSSR